MSFYYPEGWRIHTPHNRNALLNFSTLSDACRDGLILEGAPWYATVPIIL